MNATTRPEGRVEADRRRRRRDRPADGDALARLERDPEQPPLFTAAEMRALRDTRR